MGKSVSDIWDIVEKSCEGVSRDDVETWDLCKMSPFLHIFGFVGDKPFSSG